MHLISFFRFLDARERGGGRGEFCMLSCVGKCPNLAVAGLIGNAERPGTCYSTSGLQFSHPQLKGMAQPSKFFPDLGVVVFLPLAATCNVIILHTNMLQSHSCGFAKNGRFINVKAVYVRE